MLRLIAALLLFLAWVGGPAHAEVLDIVTTTTDLADAARNVGGSRVKVSSIAAGYQDPHHVETRPSYLRVLQNADAFIQTGLDLEIAWAPELLRSARNPKILPGAAGFLDASSGIKVLQRPEGRVDRTGGDVHPNGNPHYSLDPTDQKIVARTITAFLKRLDPAGSKTYDDNYRRYWNELDAADKRWKAKLAPFKGAPIVTYHNTWAYFAQHFGLRVVGQVEPQPGISPSASHLDRLSGLMRDQGVKVILMETWFPKNVATAVARKCGAKVLEMPIMPGGVKNTDSYIAMMDFIVDQLAGALR